MKLMKTKRNKEKQEINDLDKVEPIDYGVVAKPHTPIYKMHRYFARRPYTVFNELVRYYSNPGSFVLDPICGGGGTIILGKKRYKTPTAAAKAVVKRRTVNGWAFWFIRDSNGDWVRLCDFKG